MIWKSSLILVLSEILSIQVLLSQSDPWQNSIPNQVAPQAYEFTKYGDIDRLDSLILLIAIIWASGYNKAKK